MDTEPLALESIHPALSKLDVCTAENKIRSKTIDSTSDNVVRLQWGMTIYQPSPT